MKITQASLGVQGRFWRKDWPLLGLPDAAQPLFNFVDGYPRVSFPIMPPAIADHSLTGLNDSLSIESEEAPLPKASEISAATKTVVFLWFCSTLLLHILCAECLLC